MDEETRSNPPQDGDAPAEEEVVKRKCTPARLTLAGDYEECGLQLAEIDWEKEELAEWQIDCYKVS